MIWGGTLLDPALSRGRQGPYVPCNEGSPARLRNVPRVRAPSPVPTKIATWTYGPGGVSSRGGGKMIWGNPP